MSEQLENMRALGSRTYIVWTQAGFKKAVRMLNRIEDDNDPVEGYPTQYPALVRFFPGYRGYHYWFASCTPLGEAIEDARNVLQALENADAQHRDAVESRRAAP